MDSEPSVNRSTRLSRTYVRKYSRLPSTSDTYPISTTMALATKIDLMQQSAS